MHHAREPVSMLMNLNIVFVIIKELAADNPLVKELISSRNIYIIPLLNIDGYIINTDIYKSKGTYGEARKNGRDDPETFASCNYGVRLS